MQNHETKSFYRSALLCLGSKMQIFVFPLAAVLLSFSLAAQHKHQTDALSIFPPEISYQKITLDSEADWHSSLEKQYLTHGELSLAEGRVRPSPLGQHHRYRLHFMGLPLHNAELMLHDLQAGDLLLVIPQWPSEILPQQGAAPSGENLAAQLGTDSLHREPAYFLSPQAFIEGVSFQFFGDDGLHYHAFAHGQEWIYLQDQRQYNGPDSTVSGMVFAPDPLTTANIFYGGNFVDNNDADHPALNNERISVNFKAHYQNGLFRLKNDFVEIAEFSSPVIPPVTSTTPQFNYTRSQSGFEDVNAFFHLVNYLDHLQQIGFDSIPDALIQFDVHALSGADNSYFNANEARIYMGEGGVDDAEDADVVIHEYIHALVWSAIGLSARSGERSALDEAVADYFALSYSLSFSPHQNDRVFNWDGHNPFWPGRMVVSQKDYQQISFTNNIYLHTDLLGGCLREILQNTDRATTDRLVWGANYFLTGSSSYRNFAEDMLFVDQQLYGGQHFQIIRDAFVRRNVLPADVGLAEIGQAAAPELYNQAAFASGQAAFLRSDERRLRQIELYSADGRRLWRKMVSDENRLSISGAGLSSGIYILNVEDEQGRLYRFKLLRF